MILNKHGHIRTANQLAKELVYEHGAAVNKTCWHTVIPDVYAQRLTGREEDMVHTAIDNQAARVDKLFGGVDTKTSNEDKK
jgi:hypothetical protein